MRRPPVTSDVFHQTELARSPILPWIDYCNAVLHGTPTGTIQKLQRVQNNAAQTVLQASRQFHAKPLLHELHWLPVQQWITYKLAVLTYKVWNTSTPVYLHDQITEPVCTVQPNFTFIFHPAAGPTVHQDRLFQARFPVFSNICLELCHKQFCSATLFLNPDLKLFNQAFTEH